MDAQDIYAVEENLDQRIAVLRRYRRMLELQRGKLQDYLVLIDTRQEAIQGGDVEKLELYTHQEQGVISGIMSVQKCLEPLAELYRRVAPEGSPDIDELHERLEHLRGSILARNAENVSILKGHMQHLRREIETLRLPKSPRPVYAAVAEPQLLSVYG